MNRHNLSVNVTFSLIDSPIVDLQIQKTDDFFFKIVVSFRQRAGKYVKNASMWNKIYLVVLAIAILAMGVLLYLPYSWLQSVTAPKDVAAQYNFYSNISWMFLLFSSLVLLIAGNVVLWKTRRSWAMWTALLYFAVFMVAQTFWLDRDFFNYQQKHNLTDSLISFGALSGVILIVLAAIIVFFNQYLAKRMHVKMYPAVTQPVEALPEESSATEKDI